MSDEKEAGIIYSPYMSVFLTGTLRFNNTNKKKVDLEYDSINSSGITELCDWKQEHYSLDMLRRP